MTNRRVLELMTALQQAANERAEAEANIQATYGTRIEKIEQLFQSSQSQVAEQHLKRRRELENEYGEAKREAAARFQSEKDQLLAQLKERLDELEAQHAKVQKAAEHEKSETQWQALSLYDGLKDQPEEQRVEKLNYIQAQSRQVEGLRRDAQSLISLRRLEKAAKQLTPQPSSTAENVPEPTAALTAAVGELRTQILQLQDQRIPSLFLEGWRGVAWFLPSAILAAIPAWSLSGGSWPLALMGTLGGGIALTLVLLAIFMPMGRRQSLSLYQSILNHLGIAGELESAAREAAETTCQQQQQAHLAARDKDLTESAEKCEAAILASQTSCNRLEEQLTKKVHDKIETLAAERQSALDAIEEKYPPLLETHVQNRIAAEQSLSEKRKKDLAAAETQRETTWNGMKSKWEASYATITCELARAKQDFDSILPNWQKTDYSSWSRPNTLPASLRFGKATLPMKSIRNAISEDERLRPEQTSLDLPALMTLADSPNLLVSASGKMRAKASELLQVLLLKFLTTAPAGKLRITAIDAAGLGESFGGLAHLSDYHDQLIGKQIWTDSKDIAGQLALLSDHIEKVLQQYLRNDFATIHEYNAHAGEVAEPYHVIAVANFPAGFTELTAKRLENLAAAGPRCGVHVLLSVDSELKLPHDFSLEKLRENAVKLVAREDQFAWDYPLFDRLPLKLDQLPSPDILNKILRIAGEESRIASKVEVPFSWIAPEEGELWNSNSGRSLEAPIGRAGARQLQSLSLGKGTSQHVLISGKTGSGKSTLLHAMITNLAMHYGPDQLEFYLVDFKKGVEFAAYSTGKLPHARVIAIESEREFGVSVLERLDVELRRRGELFRQHGVQDVAGLREAAPDELLPRTVLIIDEFQELFVADDRLAQDAALLLDRLVRQGRAFGIHVILGSQSLSGAYSLARSTLGQMAVRVALECSEADANLILSDENSAARLLSRPGEAIYNDQNGFVEGNHTFQVAWLPDAQRRDYLKQLAERQQKSSLTFDPAIVFEGNVPADPSHNEELKQSLAGFAACEENNLWLGSSVRIEPPLKISLKRQSGANLAIVGGDESMAFGMLSTAVLALAAKPGDKPVSLTILDGTRSESEQPDQWETLAPLFGERLQRMLPDAAATQIASLHELLFSRTNAAEASTPEERLASHFVVLHDLSQFRDLRLTEDDFSFSTGGANKPPSTDKMFRQLLKEGPAVGIHFLFWCESYNSLTRAVDRLTLREIDFRVAMQMSAADSTSLIDSPAAAQLGEHRALFYRDDLGTQTKFRPYGRPSEAWLAEAASLLKRSPQPAL